MLYAQINRKTNLIVNNPGRLPDRWTTPEGATITHFNKLSKLSLQIFNWLPVIYIKLIEGTKHSLIPFYDEINQQFVYEAIPQDINILIKESKRRIDEAASFTCDKYISKGIGQECRYMIKREQAIKFLADQTPDMTDYPMIKCEAESCNITNVDLAHLIINTSEIWIDLAAKVEASRVRGKKKCSEAKDITEIIQYRNEAIAALELI